MQQNNATKILLFIIFIGFSLYESVLSQDFAIYQYLHNDIGTFNTQRASISGGLLLSSVAVITLTIDDAYYQDDRVKFHFAKDIDGNLTWFDNRHRAMDKYGHIFTTSLFSQNIYFLSRWTGYSNRTSSILASSISIGLLGAMEVWDAHFESWGFSMGDFVSNVAGGLFPVAQTNIPFLHSLDYKMSYNFLNEKSPDHGIHDYENMTFWLTINPRGVSNSKIIRWFPNWLNLAAGVGLDSYNNQKRDVFIGLDYNLKRIKTNYVILNQIIALLDRFHFPAPAIRISPSTIYYGLFF